MSMDIENLLRTTALDPQPGFPAVTGDRSRVAWRRGRRRRALGRGATATTVVAVVAGTAGLLAHVGVGGAAQPSTLTTTPGVVSSRPPVCAALPSDARCPDPQLAAISLPSPYPGYLHRVDLGLRATDEGDGHPVALERVLQIDSVPPDTGKVHGTGAFVTVRIARAGAFATTPDKTGKLDDYRVISRPTVLGQRATLIQVGKDQSQLLVTAHGFAINISGEEGPGHVTTHHDVAPQTLISVAEHIMNVPSH